MRTFTANFIAAAAKKAAKPYAVLEVDWGGATGTKYYLDRPSTAFDTNDSKRVPASGIGNSLVMQWPAISISLKEGQVGSTDQCSVVLDDASGEITAILNSAEKQRCLVTVWRLFDGPTTVWPTDAAGVFTGILYPFDWQSQNNQITLNLGDLGPLLAKDVSCIATTSIFNKLPQSSRDKNIPLCWGRAQRVEALPISVPWETKIAQSTDGNNPTTVPITDDLSLLPGVAAETPYAAYIGTDPVTATFHQSSNPTTTLSTVTLNAGSPPVYATLSSLSIIPGAAGFKVVVTYYNIQPQSLWDTLDVVVSNGQAVLVTSVGTYTNPDQTGCTVANIVKYQPGRNADDGYYYSSYSWTITLNDNVGGVLANAKTNNYALTIKLLGPAAVLNIWPAGTILRPKDQTTIYAISALPSKAVQIVEGYGNNTDSAGNTRKDFVVLGEIVQTFTQNSVTSTVTSSYFTVNLNDSTWSATLGRNITTITFYSAPRNWVPALDDNRVWCTVLGVDDAGNSTGNAITNPARVILEYLQNVNLMNVAAGSIDSASFTSAQSALAGYIVGFPQIETRPGLQLLQEIATQCNSVLLFDQGKASMVVLSDTPGTIQHTFDTTTNDNMLLGSLSTQESSVADIVNENIIKWTPYWDDITGKKPIDVRNYKASAIAAFGRIAASIPESVYIYWRRVDVETQRDWWLNHKSSIFRTVKFTTFLDALALQPGDWISVTWIDGSGRSLFGGAKSMLVTKATDAGKDGLVEIEARYVMYTYT